MNPVTIISVCICGGSLLVAAVALIMGRKDKSTDKIDEMATSLLKCNMKLDSICATTNETRTDIKSMNNKINDMDKEIEICKRDLQTAFVRIDELKSGKYLPKED